MTNRRVLKLTAATVTVVANMIGTGVFTITGLMAQSGAVGGDILLAWMLGGLIALTRLCPISTIWMTVWSIQSAPRAAFAGIATLASGYIRYLFRAKQARLAVDIVD